jgi:hypothetical protein
MTSAIGVAAAEPAMDPWPTAYVLDLECLKPALVQCARENVEAHLKSALGKIAYHDFKIIECTGGRQYSVTTYGAPTSYTACVSDADVLEDVTFTYYRTSVPLNTIHPITGCVEKLTRVVPADIAKVPEAVRPCYKRVLTEGAVREFEKRLADANEAVRKTTERVEASVQSRLVEFQACIREPSSSTGHPRNCAGHP